MSPLRIAVSGLSEHQLSGQSLRNVWLQDKHAEQECLARLQLDGGPFRHDLLERLSWALLAWPDVDVVWLEDRRSGQVLGRVERCGGQGVRAYRWRDHWLVEDAHSEFSELPPDGLDDFPPGSSNLATGWRQRVGIGQQVTGEAGIAARERLKARMQALFGAAFTRALQRLYQWFGAVRRRHQRLSCPVDAVVEALLVDAVRPSQQRPAVLMLVPRLAPGGAEKNALELARQLLAKGWRVRMVTTLSSENPWTARALADGVEVCHLPGFLPAGCWLSYLDALIRTRSIDVLHIANSHWMYEQLPALKQRHPGLPVVTQLHAEGEPGLLDYPALAAAADPFVDRHTVISQHLSAYLQKHHGVDPGRIQLIRTGIDLGEGFSPDGCRRGAWRAARGVGQDRRLVCYVGRFSELKRPMLFLDIAEQVLKERPETCFVMKGEGPLLARVEERIGRSELLSGAVLLEDASDPVPPLMCDADLLVLPSRMEGIAYVSYEAMAMGLPQVSADVGGQSELLGEGAGCLVTTGPGEAERFAVAVISLLDDPAARQAMSRTARDLLGAWQTPAQMAAEYTALYSALKAGRP